MRTLLIGALAATLAGCTCLLPPQAAIEGCTDANGFACFDRTAARQPIEAEPVSFTASTATTRVNSTVAEKMEKPSSARTRHAAKPATPAMNATSAERSESSQPAGTPDPATLKAKATIAAQLNNPASAEFVEMKRAIRKNMVGEPVDTICGRVKARNASDEDSENRPFLYFVNNDDGFVVYGPAGSASETAYRNICAGPKP